MNPGVKDVPSIDRTHLDRVVAEIQVAQRQLELAKQAVGDDKLQRSFVGRIVDAVTVTKPEAAFTAAQERSDAAVMSGQQAARTWIIETARQRLADSPSDFDRHQMQAQKFNRAQLRREKIRAWLDLAKEADRRLWSARQACSSASTTEFLDLVSKSTAISVLSSMDSSNAADAVKSAVNAVQELTKALPKRSQQADIELPDDFLDLVVDLVFVPGFDVLSLFNMNRLDDAKRQCEKASEQLQPVLDKLLKLNEDAKVKAERERASLREIEAPYLEAAARLVPEAIRVPTPIGLP